MALSPDLEAMALAAEKKYGITPGLYVSLLNYGERANPQDSTTFVPSVNGGQYGISMISGDIVDKYGVTDPYDPTQNIDAGARYFKEMRDSTGSDSGAIIAYNAGLLAGKNNKDVSTYDNSGKVIDGSQAYRARVEAGHQAWKAAQDNSSGATPVSTSSSLAPSSILSSNIPSVEAASKDPHDTAQSIKGAATMMSGYLKQYGGNYGKALAAYNAGPGNVDKNFPETQDYVSKILGAITPSAQAATTPAPQEAPQALAGDSTQTQPKPVTFSHNVNVSTDELGNATHTIKTVVPKTYQNSGVLGVSGQAIQDLPENTSNTLGQVQTGAQHWMNRANYNINKFLFGEPLANATPNPIGGGPSHIDTIPTPMPSLLPQASHVSPKVTILPAPSVVPETPPSWGEKALSNIGNATLGLIPLSGTPADAGQLLRKAGEFLARPSIQALGGQLVQSMMAKDPKSWQAQLGGHLTSDAQGTIMSSAIQKVASGETLTAGDVSGLNDEQVSKVHEIGLGALGVAQRAAAALGKGRDVSESAASRSLSNKYLALLPAEIQASFNPTLNPLTFDGVYRATLKIDPKRAQQMLDEFDASQGIKGGGTSSSSNSTPITGNDGKTYYKWSNGSIHTEAQ